MSGYYEFPLSVEVSHDQEESPTLVLNIGSHSCTGAAWRSQMPLSKVVATVRKRTLVLTNVLLLLLLILLASSPAVAASSGASVTLDRAKASISRAIARAQFLADRTGRHDSAIAAQLVKQADRIVERTERKVGADQVTHVYVLVRVGDQTVLVDPMKVAGD